MVASLSAETLLANLAKRDGQEPEFMAAAEEVITSLKPVFETLPQYLNVMEQLLEPERMIMFRVSWLDDAGKVQVNRGFRVQFNGALGPYKGGLRLHPTVTLSVMKFLGFEQIFKNALTGLPLGAGKGGSDFNPRGRSDGEIMRFCQSFMTELVHHIGPNTDVPAGDIGVGGREIGYLFGQYRRLKHSWEGSLTGKGHLYGGSLLRPEATGYGAVLFAAACLRDNGKSLKGTKCVLSGSGNVSQFCAEKLLSMGAVVLTFSDSSGYVYEPTGFTTEQVEFVKELKNVKRGRISEYCEFSTTATFVASKRPWEVKGDYAFPCATQNEVEEDDAKSLVTLGFDGVFEGANMPSTKEAITCYQQAGMIYGPAKAVNAGGVAVSGLEMAQNAEHLYWTSQEVEQRLESIMENIYNQCASYAKQFGQPGNLQLGANAAGFLRVADAMIAQGAI